EAALTSWMRAAATAGPTVEPVTTLHRRTSRRSRRGVAMLITVLLLVVAASITFAVSRQAAMSVHADGSRAASERAMGLARENLVLASARLSESPTGFLGTVWPEERARVCTYRGGTVNVQP